MPTKKTRSHADDLRGAARLAAHATRGVTDVVESMHRTIASGPAFLGSPLALPVRLLTAPIYGSIRVIAGLVGTTVEAALSRAGSLLGASAPGLEREAFVAALNGVFGDFLAETNNPLAIDMQLRRDGVALDLDPLALRDALPDAGDRVVVFVHGSSMNDLQWASGDHATRLARERGMFPVFLQYNSGLHVSTNGRMFANILERMCDAWPRPIARLAIVAHSMGGLVSRSACYAGEAVGHRWRESLDTIVFIGTPHHGAPLERGGAWLHVLLGATAYSAPLARLARIRSAGVTDLRFGNVLDAHWEGRDRFAVARDSRRPLALPEGVRCFAIAGTTSAPGAKALHGDGLVPVDSALGRHTTTEMDLGIEEARRWVAYKTGHMALITRPEVSAKIAEWV